MPVNIASRFVSRATRVAIKEALFAATSRIPANQATQSSAKPSLRDVGKIDRRFGQELSHRLNAYAVSVDPSDAPGSMVDTWRVQFGEPDTNLHAANGSPAQRKRQFSR